MPHVFDYVGQLDIHLTGPHPSLLLHLRDTYPVETARAPNTSGTSSARSATLPGTPA